MIGKTHANTKVMHINIAESDEESLDDESSDDMTGMKWREEVRCKGRKNQGNEKRNNTK